MCCTHVCEYACLHMCGLIHVGLCVCMHVCGDPRLVLGIFLAALPPCSLRQGLSVKLELAGAMACLASQLALGIPHVHLSRLELQMESDTHQASCRLWGLELQSSGFHGCLFGC